MITVYGGCIIYVQCRMVGVAKAVITLN